MSSQTPCWGPRAACWGSGGAAPTPGSGGGTRKRPEVRFAHQDCAARVTKGFGNIKLMSPLPYRPSSPAGAPVRPRPEAGTQPLVPRGGVEQPDPEPEPQSQGADVDRERGQLGLCLSGVQSQETSASPGPGWVTGHTFLLEESVNLGGIAHFQQNKQTNSLQRGQDWQLKALTSWMGTSVIPEWKPVVPPRTTTPAPPMAGSSD